MIKLIALALVALAATSTLATACQFHQTQAMADPSAVTMAQAPDDAVATTDVSTANHLVTD